VESRSHRPSAPQAGVADRRPAQAHASTAGRRWPVQDLGDAVDDVPRHLSTATLLGAWTKTSRSTRMVSNSVSNKLPVIYPKDGACSSGMTDDAWIRFYEVYLTAGVRPDPRTAHPMMDSAAMGAQSLTSLRSWRGRKPGPGKLLRAKQPA